MTDTQRRETLDVDKSLEIDSYPLLELESKSSRSPDSNQVHNRTGENQTIIWLLLTAPLVLHFVSVVILTLVLTLYISGNSYNLDSRRALSKYAPLQSDITTAVSGGVSVLRIFTTMWITSTVWRCIYILMENGGMSLQEIDFLISCKIYLSFPPFRPLASRRARLGLLVSVILLAALPSQLSGPILTGSITWTPSHGFLKGEPLEVATRFTLSDWSQYNFSSLYSHLHPLHTQTSIVVFRGDAVTAAYVAFIAWPKQGSLGDDGRTTKRVTSKAALLPVNSTFSNITLPYFAVTKLEWIANPRSELPDNVFQTVANNSLYNPFYNGIVNTFSIIPDNWEIPTPPPTPFTGIVTETRLLAGVYSQSSGGDPCDAPSPFGQVPQGIGLTNISVPHQNPACFVFARVTYTAGASDCTGCRLSSWITVQNDSSLTVQPDIASVDSLDMMPLVSLQMAAQNISLPNAYNNLNGYVTGLLTRSYGTSWNFLMDTIVDDGQTPGIVTDVQVAVPTSKANVLLSRVMIWLALNVMFTLSGLLFLIVQYRCGQRVVLDAAMAALLLDTSSVLHKNDRALCDFSSLVKGDNDIGCVKLQQDEFGHRQVVVGEK